MRYAIVLSFTLLMSCGTANKMTKYASLLDTAWKLKSITGMDMSSFTNGIPFLNFGSDGVLSGNDGCNDFTGSFTSDASGLLNLGNLASTKKACPGNSDAGFMDALGQVSSFSMDGDNLNLNNAAGTVMSFLPK